MCRWLKCVAKGPAVLEVRGKSLSTNPASKTLNERAREAGSKDLCHPPQRRRRLYANGPDIHPLPARWIFCCYASGRGGWGSARYQVGICTKLREWGLASVAS